MMWLSNETEWLASRVDKWVAQCQGYSKLRSCRLSRGYQTMLVKPDPCKIFWSRADSAVLDDEVEIDTSCAIPDNNNSISYKPKTKVANHISHLQRGTISVENLKSKVQGNDEFDPSDEFLENANLFQHSQSLKELNSLNDFKSSSASNLFYSEVAPVKSKRALASRNAKNAGNINRSQFSEPVININDNFIEIIQDDNSENISRPLTGYKVQSSLRKENAVDIYKNYNVYNTTELSPISYNTKYRKYSTSNENANSARLSSRKINNINKNVVARDLEKKNSVKKKPELKVNILQDEINYSVIFKKCKPKQKPSLDEHRELNQSGNNFNSEDRDSVNRDFSELNWIFSDQNTKSNQTLSQESL